MNKKVLEKIKNLLDMTVENGCTIAEAANAAKKAQSLIAEFNVSMSQLDIKEEVGEESIKISRQWMKSLASIVSKNMCCEYIISIRNRKVTARFTGLETHRKSCVAMYEKLILACQNGIREEKRKHINVTGVEAVYSNGFLKAVREGMEEQCRALVLVVPKEVKEEFNNKYANIKVRTFHNNCGEGCLDKNSAVDIFKAGYSRGKEISSRKKLN